MAMKRQPGATGVCRTCGAMIVWLRTRNDKWNPVDASTVAIGDKAYEHGRHISHYATCPQAKQWRLEADLSRSATMRDLDGLRRELHELSHRVTILESAAGPAELPFDPNVHC